MARNEAVTFPVRCINTHHTFHARYDFAYDGVWVLSYGLKELPADGASVGGGAAKVDISKARTGPQYKCPHCGSRHFVRCGKCRSLTCWNGRGSFTCDHCGNRGAVSGTIGTMEGRLKHSQ
ncbi:MAG: hypothetical protein IKY17_00255 [Oscillospiraceae bacterium]|nr:hypothetical protein [Oscillospiraceae bacterium]